MITIKTFTLKNLRKSISIFIFFNCLLPGYTNAQCNTNESWDITGPASFCSGLGPHLYQLILPTSPCSSGTWVVAGAQSFTINSNNTCTVTWSNPIQGVNQYIAYVVNLNTSCPNNTSGDTIYMQECRYELISPGNPNFYDGDMVALYNWAIAQGFQVAGTPDEPIILNAKFTMNGLVLIGINQGSPQGLTLDNCEIYMGPGAQIKVGRAVPGPYIYLRNNTRINAVTANNNLSKPPVMWHGIKCGIGNFIEIYDSKVNDAHIAITIYVKAKVDLVRSEFKRNYTTYLIPDNNGVFCLTQPHINHLIEDNLFDGLPLIANGNFFNGQYPEPQGNYALTAFLVHNVRTIPLEFSKNGLNTFNRLNCGIAAYNSHLEIFNCNFTGMKFDFDYSNYAFSGFAISNENFQNNTPFPVMNVGEANHQNNISGTNGIYVFGNVTTKISHNNVNFGNTGISYGVLMRQNKRCSIDINNNEFNYPTHGITVYEMSNATPSLNILNNQITGRIDASGTVNSFEGISIYNSLPFKIPVEINRNEITDFRNGLIVFNQYANDYFNILDNQITLNADPSSVLQSFHTGIWLSNCTYPKVHENTITWPNAPFLPTGFSNYLNGLLAENVIRASVFHNTINSFGTGMYWRNVCPGSQMICNNFNHCYPGVYFDNITFSTQGNSCHATYNNFNDDLSGTHLRIDGFSQSGNPVVWYYSGPSINSNTEWPQPSALNLILPQLVASTCGPPWPPCGGPDPDFTVLIDNRSDEWLQEVAEDSMPYQFLHESNEFSNRDAAFKTMDDEPLLVNTFEKQLFMDAETANSIGLLKMAEGHVYNEENNAAWSVLSTVNPEGIWETNKKQVLEIYLSTISQQVYWLTSVQYDAIHAVALQNAAEGGEAVYWARGMLQMPVMESGFAAFRQSILSPELPVKSLEVFDSGNYSIINSLKEELSGIVIYDLFGREVLNKNVTGKWVTINKNLFSDGIYIFKAISVSGRIYTLKVLLNK